MNDYTEYQASKFHLKDYWRVIRNRWAVILTIFILVVATGYYWTNSLAKVYASQALVRVQTDQRQGPTTILDREHLEPLWLQTEFEIIQSDKILVPVVRELDLVNRWSSRLGVPAEELTPERVAAILKNNYVRVEARRNTQLIEITVHSQDPQEAAELANAIARSYETVRRNEIEEKSSRVLQLQRAEVEKQRKATELAKDRMERFRAENQMDLVMDQGSIRSAQELELQNLEGRLSELRMDLTAREVRLGALENLSLSQLREVMTTIGLRDAAVESVHQQYLSTEAALEGLRQQGYGAEHPSVLAAQSQLEKLKKQLLGLLEGIRNGLIIDLDVARARFKVLEERVAAMRERVRSEKTNLQSEFRELQNEYELQRSLLANQEVRLRQVEIDAGLDVKPVEVMTKAQVNPVPVWPSLLWNMVVAVMVGLVLGIAFAFFIEYLDTSIKTMDDVERYLGCSVLGVIPKGVQPLNLEGPDSPSAEAYRILRAKIDLQRAHNGAMTVTVVSGGPSEGKTTTLFNLGYVCAHSGMKTLIVDCDFRRHSLNAVLGIDNNYGLADFLLNRAALTDVIKATELENLHVITAGRMPATHMGILNPVKMTEIVQTLKPCYDVILFDAPPILGISDAAVVSHHVDLTLLVIQHRRYPRDVSLRAKRVIEEVGGRLYGVVLNDVHLKSDDSYYYYTYYHGEVGEEGVFASREEVQRRAREAKKRLRKKNKEIEQAEAFSGNKVSIESDTSVSGPGQSNHSNFTREHESPY